MQCASPFVFLLFDAHSTTEPLLPPCHRRLRPHFTISEPTPGYCLGAARLDDGNHNHDIIGACLSLARQGKGDGQKGLGFYPLSMQASPSSPPSIDSFLIDNPQRFHYLATRQSRGIQGSFGPVERSRALERVHFILYPGAAFLLVGTAARVHSLPQCALSGWRRYRWRGECPFLRPCVGTVGCIEVHSGRYGYAEDEFRTAHRRV